MVDIPAEVVVSGESFPRIRVDVPGGALDVSILRRVAGGDDGETLGSWSFEGVRPGPADLVIDWLAGGEGLLSIYYADGERWPGAVRASRDPDVVISPDMAIRIASAEDSWDIPVKVADTSLLERYYRQGSHQDEYVTEHPFFHSFHQARLRTLGRLFNTYIRPGSMVLDVGSGYSIFFLLSTDWDFDITCCDLDSAAMEKMRGLVPEWKWVVADAARLPWGDGVFDTVYAGEIIEHVPDPTAALCEWRRVLAPGGTLILSTPNRDRLLAKTNHRAMPVHPEHIVEMNLGETRSLLSSNGFEVQKETGIYLEWILNWWRPPGKRVDWLTARLTSPRFGFLYRLSMELGRLAPSVAYDLVLVCRKR
ncbi:MAG: class I SAM-dependent methyltransferase [Actinomycetia bacterium]|nr:class I SAM-dependent methyltransferase [Actinomycetes bacterium]